MRWVMEGSHSIVPSKDLDRSAAVVKTGESVKVNVHTTGSRMEWFEATVIARGKRDAVAIRTCHQNQLACCVYSTMSHM